MEMQTRDAAKLTGKLYFITILDGCVYFRLKTQYYGVVNCTAAVNRIKELRGYLSEVVTVEGYGFFSRSSNGKWNIDNLEMFDCYLPTPGNLREQVDRLRALDIAWPDDPIQAIRNIEEKDGKSGDCRAG